MTRFAHADVRPALTAILLTLGAGFYSGAALAQETTTAEGLERSLDTQLVFPVLSPDGLIAIDSPRPTDKLKFVGGVAYQLEREPLEYFENGEPKGAAVNARNAIDLGGALSITSSTTVFVRLGAVLQDAGADPAVGPSSTMGLADANLGFKAAVIQRPKFALGPRFDLWLPIGTKESWIAEQNARYVPSILVDWNPGPVRVFGTVGLQARTTTDSRADLLLSSELTGGLGLQVPISHRFSAMGEATARSGFSRFLQNVMSGAETPAEGHLGVRYRIPHKMQFDLAGGTGFDNGYGTADLRVIASVTFLPPPPPPPKPPKVVEVEETKAAVVQIEEAPVKVEWAPEEKAKVSNGQIIIREPIQFEFATPNILPESIPTLNAVAEVMNNYPQIEYLTIEGHASKEGSNIYNYDLSNNRARAVFEALIRAGVRPDRLNYRGLGETKPLCDTEDEACLAQNRRVEFHILKVRDWLELPKTPDTAPLILPWSGDSMPAPKMGDKMLTADANPILVEEVIKAPVNVEKPVDAGTFKEKLDESDDFMDESGKKKAGSEKPGTEEPPAATPEGAPTEGAPAVTPPATEPAPAAAPPATEPAPAPAPAPTDPSGSTTPSEGQEQPK
jgi:outer membrane protein OmpA-like peptidoglycan-associated protein